MKKILIKLATILAVVTLFAGCANIGENKKVEEKPEAQATEVVINHPKGEVKVKESPEKIAVLDMGMLDILQELDINSEMIIPTKTLPKDLEKFKDSKNAGSIVDPDMEAIYEFKPDVIFISGRQQKLFDKFSEIAPTIYVDVQPETYMDDVKRNINIAADIYNKKDIADKKIEELDKNVNEAKEIASKSDEKALVVLTNDGSISAYGKGSRFGIIHDVLGVKPADENIKTATHGQEASYEYISKINPDIIYVIDRTAVVGGTVMADKTMENDLIKGTNASKNGKIVYLNPETWYLTNGGLNAVDSMVEEVTNSIK